MRGGPKLYIRGGIWWCRVRDRRGKIIRRTTKCRDYEAAQRAAREFERIAADPTHAAASETFLAEAINDFFADLKRRKRSAATMEIAETKCGHFVRLWKPDLPLLKIDASLVLEYIDTRQKEGVVDFTIKKELDHLRQTLLLARHKGTFHLELDRVMPPFFHGSHKPRKRVLPLEELAALMASFPKRRAAHLAFFAATGARLSEAENAARADVDWGTRLVHLHGTKTEGSDRFVPITPITEKLLAWALEHAPGHRPLFHPWGKLHRDVHAACVRAGIAPATPNDLRRSFATWHRDAGVDPSRIAPLLGHTTDKLAQTTYGKLRPAELGRLLESQLRPVPISSQSTRTDDENDKHPRDDRGRKQAPPAEVESATNGLGNRSTSDGRSARSVGTKLGIQRARVRASVPNLKPEDPAETGGAEAQSGGADEDEDDEPAALSCPFLRTAA